jgi:diacylglycerol kinase family enzyme
MQTMRAVVIANPRATAVGVQERDLLARALRGVAHVDDVHETHGRGHATELAAKARAAGVDLVVALGGDGTVNEVVQGLLAGEGAPDDAGTPLLGVVPAGSTNVFARALGLPNDAVRAINALLDAIENGRERRVGLGQADDRWFTFSAGLGLDAAVVGAVEQRRRAGRRSTPQLYVRLAVREYLRTRRHPAHLTLTRPEGPAVHDLELAVVTNAAPWTFFNARPVNPTPEASFDTGLDIYARSSMRLPGLTRALAQIVRPGGHPHDGATTLLHDLAEFTIDSDVPLPFQVDGDYLGRRTTVRFRARPAALRVAC